jgi:hypothetical protein
VLSSDWRNPSTLRILEGRTDLVEVQSRHARAKDEWKKVQKQIGGK